jgi:hypothetical protein
MDMDEGGFEKRRRNLMLSSFALLAAAWTKAMVSETAVAGVTVKPPVVHSLAFYLLFLTLYFAWRYWPASPSPVY